MSKREMRQHNGKMTVRELEDNDEMVLEGRFITFNDVTELWEGVTESISPSVAQDITGDIRALINHEWTQVLGRTTANTLQLWVEEDGVYGRIYINKKDVDAVNLYERVKRRDVTGNSFGFDILEETEEVDYDNGTVHYEIKRIKLYEVSVVTFPAYENTTIQAREKAVEKLKTREFKSKLTKLRSKIDNIIKEVK